MFQLQASDTYKCANAVASAQIKLASALNITMVNLNHNVTKADANLVSLCGIIKGYHI